MKKIGSFYLLIGLYFGFASVYWVGASGHPEVIRIAKFILLSTIVLMAFLVFFGERIIRFVPSGYFGVTHFTVFLMLSTPGFLQAENYSVMLKYFVNLTVPYIFCWLMWVINYNFKYSYESLYVFQGAKLIVPFFLLIILSKIIGWPNWYNPYLSDVGLIDSGFGGSRTSWGVGVALVFPLTFAGLILHEINIKSFVTNVAYCILGVLAAAIPTSRGALLAMAINLIVVALILPKQRLNKLIIGLLCFFSLVGLALNYAQDLRLSGINADGDAVDVSSGRGIAMDYGILLLKDRPLLGYGFDEVVVQVNLNERIEIHNSVLNQAVAAGTFSALFFYGSLVIFLLKEFAGARQKKEKYIYCMVILNVLVCGMFEPNIIWGQVMSSMVFWYSIAKLRAN